MRQDEKYVRKIKRHDAVRIILQILIVLIVLMLFVRYLVLPDLFPEQYKKVSEDTSSSNALEISEFKASIKTDKDSYMPFQEISVPTQRANGFISLSYVAVDEEGTQTVISRERLTEHLQALKDAGYVTVTQQDIRDYYDKGKSLPENALFLFFEDGRRKSVVIAQELLQKFNYCASILSYANNLNLEDRFYLSAEDLKALEETGYWSLGTNGYRLSYINVFDRHDNYLGEMTPKEYYKISPYVRREYNHYLMDFVRDKYDIPMESKETMQKRIAEDYALMYDHYTEDLGKLPMLYCLMHSNTGQYATDSVVSVENEKLIPQYFSLNFNREMYCYNDLYTNKYDLTRMQPQAYWYTNHLLMRILYDVDNSNIHFVKGNEKRFGYWDVLQGAVEFKDDLIVVTSMPEGIGLVSLPASYGIGDFTLSTRFIGNKIGTQAIDLLADPYGSTCIAIEIQNNVFRIYRGEGMCQDIDMDIDAENKDDGAQKGSNTNPENMLFELDLDKHDGVVYQTWEENRQEALSVEIPLKYAQTYQAEESQRIAVELERAKANTANANYEDFIPDIQIKDAGDRLVEITYSNGALSVSIDGKVAVENLMVNANLGGGIALRSAWGEYGYSQRNIADDVYDGVFKSLYLTTSNNTEGKILIDYRMPEAGGNNDLQNDENSNTVEEASEGRTELSQLSRAWDTVTSGWRSVWKWVTSIHINVGSD